MKTYDLIVIGAGPAGSSAAIYASEKGVKTLIIERKKITGTPVMCAEGASVRGIELVIKKIKKRWIANKTNKVVFTGPKNKRFEVEFVYPGYILERRIFDRDLFSLASEKADTMIETEAKGIEEKYLIIEYHGKRDKVGFDNLIVADGIESRMGRLLGLSRFLKLHEIHSCAQYLISGPDFDTTSVEIILDFDKCPGGYIWIFPKDKNLANIGLGISPVLTPKPPSFFLDKFLKERFPAFRIIERSGGLVSAYVPKDFGKDRILLAGDAARLIDPMSGAGIVNGMLSGKFAGESIMEDKDVYKNYKKRLEKEFVKGLRFNEKIRNVYLKLKNKELEKVFDFGRDYLHAKRIEKFDLKSIWRMLIRYSPLFLKIARKVIW